MDSLPKKVAVGGHFREVGAISGGLTVFDAKPTLIQAYIVKNKTKTEH